MTPRPRADGWRLFRIHPGEFTRLAGMEPYAVVDGKGRVLARATSKRDAKRALALARSERDASARLVAALGHND